MLGWKKALVLRRISKACLREARRRILSGRFAMEDEWSQRHRHLVEITGGGDYEWIAAVQKKFTGGGIASAVDVDIAVVGAGEKDQLPEIVDLIYKLRHTENAADALPSTEYAAIRSTLKHEEVDTLYKFLNDPINYGVFLNVHAGCLTIEHFLKKGDVKGAARTASFIMQQELFESLLLNFACVYSALKWTELPTEERIFDSVEPSSSTEEEDISEDDMRVFKFPYLKNEYFDGHFDLTDSNMLVGKTLLWMSKLLGLDVVFARSIDLVGSIFFGDFDKAIAILKDGSVYPSAVETCRSRITQLSAIDASGETPSSTELYDNLLKALDEVPKCDSTDKMSDVLQKWFQPFLIPEEQKVIENQRDEFERWNANRMTLIRAQTEQANYRLRLKEIEEERKQLEEQKEMRHFFKNRLHWEDLAEQKDAIYEEFKLLEAEKKMTDEQYTRTIFEKAKERKIPLSKL